MCYGMRLMAPIVFIFVGILSWLVWQIHHAIHAVNDFFSPQQPAGLNKTSEFGLIGRLKIRPAIRRELL